jgi:hypothetical protein
VGIPHAGSHVLRDAPPRAVGPRYSTGSPRTPRASTARSTG